MSHAHEGGAAAHADYHGHPNYFRVWLALVALFAVSLLFGLLGNHRLAVSLIFALAVVKAILVVGNFMHLRWEPRLLWVAAGFGFLVLGFFYFGVYPDIVPVPPQVAR
ncbi:MAG: cytochrome C oxidase subunit IV family protein [Gemmatimonadales bacterium]|jgi:caa(3)-type oxidase subunit IV|nr:cytochrome C oxidase subunit IV family protein [Gemmatimonadales bacterium]MBP9199304.1 cytochrome C oxidase subunit IV family protein [Gemmatimonadales bacterium]